MNLGQNKFYVGFGAVMLLSCGILTWFVIQASSEFDAAETKYQEQVVKLKALQNLPLYPERSNLKILEEQKEAAQEAVISLHQQLLPRAFPLEAMTPEQFQDKLNEAVKNTEAKATKMGVHLADKFYLGFTQYRTATPRPEAAAALGRQLKCVEMVINTLIEKKVTSIGDIVRDALPEEADPAKSLAQTPSAKGKGKPLAPVVPLVSKNPFKVTFVSDQQPFQSAINELSKNEQQFLIVRPLSIKNQVDKSPKKIDPAAEKPAVSTAPADAAAAVGAVPSATPKPEPLQYVFGAEKINVTLRLDSVFFASNLPK